MKKRSKIVSSLCVIATVTASWLALASPASAASLTQITNFGTNPTNLGMYEYVPNTVTANPAIVVAVHQCTGSGPGFYAGTEFASLADRYGFIVIYPSATRSGNCFDVSSASALTHSGNSDPVGIVSMVRYVEQHNNGDPNRVYVTGASSGGMMTNVLLGDYPDVFKAGAAFMGVPFGCFATSDPSGWNAACATGTITKTPQQWGDLARAADPGYAGPRPRMQLWHGTADATLSYTNFGEEIKQWTNVLGVSQTPTTTDHPQSTWTHTRYTSSNGTTQVEAFSIQGAGHTLPTSGMAAYAIQFFGLTGSTPPTPPPTTTPPTAPPTTAPPSGGTGNCRVSDSISAWNTGLTSNITITNTSSSTVSGWSLSFTLPGGQVITSAWSATYAPTTGQVTATSLSYNVTIAPGGSTTIGFNANHTGNTAAPTAFALNGRACTTG